MLQHSNDIASILVRLSQPNECLTDSVFQIPPHLFVVGFLLHKQYNEFLFSIHRTIHHHYKNRSCVLGHKPWIIIRNKDTLIFLIWDCLCRLLFSCDVLALFWPRLDFLLYFSITSFQSNFWNAVWHDKW